MIEYMHQAGVSVENVLPIEENCLNTIQYGATKLSFWQKTSSDVKYVYQARQYLSHFFKTDLSSAKGLKEVGEMSVTTFLQTYQLSELQNVFESYVNKKFKIPMKEDDSSIFNFHNLQTFFQLPRVRFHNQSKQMEDHEEHINNTESNSILNGFKLF